jgi:hypothetical protein
MLSFVVSTLAFFIVAFFVRRHLDEGGVPSTMGRGVVVFVIALAAAYSIAAIVDWVAGLFA